MVVRSFPIRVAGNSGPLFGETTWEEIARNAGREEDLREYTTVTQRLRRVGRFDVELVRRALAVNSPTRLVLNHLDFIGAERDLLDPSTGTSRFVRRIEEGLGQTIDWFGFSGLGIVENEVQEA